MEDGDGAAADAAAKGTAGPIGEIVIAEEEVDISSADAALAMAARRRGGGGEDSLALIPSLRIGLGFLGGV